jgi:hypothetical protein
LPKPEANDRVPLESLAGKTELNQT